VHAADRIAASSAFATVGHLWDAAANLAFSVAMLVLSFVLLGPARVIWPWGMASAENVVAAIEAASETAVAERSGPRRGATPGTIAVNLSTTDDSNSGWAAGSRSNSNHALGRFVGQSGSPYRGHSSDVNIETPADFATTGRE